MAKQKNEIIATKDLKYSNNFDTYTIQLKKRRNYWWLLLLLMPLLLLIKCERSLAVRCYDADTQNAVEEAKVTLKYKTYYLVDNTGLFPEYEYVDEAIADENGLVEFDNIRCGVFCFFFHIRSQMEISAEGDCYPSTDTSLLLHGHKTVRLPMKQRTGLPICVVDKDTYEGLPEARVKWEMNLGNPGSIEVDNEGNGMLTDVPLCHGTIARIDASADGYYDTTYYNFSIDDFGRDCVTIKMRPKIDNYHLDIVMCIDNTGSMGKLISLVKNNALGFHSDLKTTCAKKRKKIDDIRLRVLSFGDFREKPISESGLLQIPAQTDAFRVFVNGIEAQGGGDGPEDALEAVAMAIKTGWNSGVTRRRYIVIVYTDAPAHDLGFNRYSMFYPQEPIPSDFEELTDWWNHLDRRASRLILFAPNEDYWSRMNKEWPNVYLKPLEEVLQGTTGYEQILDAIANSL